MNAKAVFGALLNHYPELPAVIAKAQALEQAAGVPAKWEATKGLGDSLMPAITDVVAAATSPSTLSTKDEEQFACAVRALPDGPLEATHVEALGLFNRRPTQIDPTTGQPLPRFDGSLLKSLLANLPGIMAAIEKLLPLFGVAK